MRVIIAGSRHLTRVDYPLLERAIHYVRKKHKWPPITEVVCGEALGGDALGKRWAIENNIPYESFVPDWGDPDDPNPEAGFSRNDDMAVYAASEKVNGRKVQGALLALWDGHSSGTADMIKRARRHKLLVYVASTGGRTPKR